MLNIFLQCFCLFFTGILAGEEFIVRYGIQPVLNKLDDKAHLQARIFLVKRLKWVVPSIMLPSTFFTIVSLVRNFQHESVYLWIGSFSLLAFVLFSFLGTVPINMKVNDWNTDNPPKDWKSVVKRWEFIDTFRSSAAIVAFIFLIFAFA